MNTSSLREAVGDSREAVGDSREAVVDSREAVGDSREAVGDSREAVREAEGELGGVSSSRDEVATGRAKREGEEKEGVGGLSAPSSAHATDVCV